MMTLNAIRTKYGWVQGSFNRDGDVICYKGIPFAAPPIGDLRFLPPQPPISWDGKLICDHDPPACVQPVANAGWQIHDTYTTDEDCLYLNIWAPAEKEEAPLPVMLWLHGGGFTTGRATAPVTNGIAMARKGVILVTCAFRCGPLGFFAHPGVNRRAGMEQSYNLGLLDQLAALRWVHENIAVFGGDASNVTLFGQSSGGVSTRMLLCSPIAKDLFHRVIVQSGGGLNEADPIRTKEEMEEICIQVLDNLGWTVDDLFSKDAQEVTEELVKAGKNVKENELYVFQPFIDGYTILDIPGEVLARGDYPGSVSLMCGTVSGDSWMFTRKVMDQLKGNDAASRAFSYSPTISWARAQIANHHAPLYGYFFEHVQPSLIGNNHDSAGGKAPHGSEIPYVFGSLDSCESASDSPWTDEDYALSDAMVSYWTNFAKTGDPNGAGLIHWHPFTERSPEVMHFCNDGWQMEDIIDGSEAEKTIQYTICHPGFLEHLENFE